jgi:hypothetical protein
MADRRPGLNISRVHSTHRTVLLLLLAAVARLPAQRALPAVDSGSATISDSGVTVRFPRTMSPDSITREMPVQDLFSGYEWRVALVGGTQTLLAALVLPPNDSLLMHRFRTIRELYMAGDLRQCRRGDLVLECERPARGLVRDAGGAVEIGIVDPRWIIEAIASTHPVIRLVVKRNREVLWTRDIALAGHSP